MIQNQHTGTASPLYDVRALQKLREIDPSGVFLRRWIRLFLAEAPEKLGLMERAAEAGIAEPIRRIAHSLKSYAGWLGSQQLWSLCDRLEEAAQRGRLDECRRLLPALRRQLQLFHEWLARFLAAQG